MTGWLVGVAVLSFLCALVPAVLFAVNLREYREPPALPATRLPAVSILIPARNEAAGIADCLRAALASRNIAFEIIVMDDGSTDATPSIVRSIAESETLHTQNSQLENSPVESLESVFHPSIRLEDAPPLPQGWNGKQHACWELAHAARSPILCFVDADVRLGPDCLARMAAFLDTSDSSLVSGFPRQITGTTLEWLLLPLIHFVLLGFLPIARMRMGTDPALAAGCGQFLMVRAPDYFRAGGHSGIKLTMHDGLRLPRLFREHGMRTDLADITHLATCRMYTSASQVWLGLAKNATEGIAAPARIVPVTILLLLGQVIPFLGLAFIAGGFICLVLIAGAFGIGVRIARPAAFWSFLLLIIGGACLSYLPRILATRRFQQDWRSALLHPIGILVLLILQWYALGRKILGSPIGWRDRTYS